MSLSRFRLVPVAAPLLWSAMLGAAQAASPVLLPHHAVYKLSLASSNGSKAPADASGMIAYDFTGSACGGYTTVFRQVTALQPSEGDARVSDTKTTTTESGDAKQFAFDSTTTVDKGDVQDVKGTAQRQGDGTVDVSLERPEAASIDLKTGILFPTEHLQAIIARAEEGGKILTASVYDGSDTGRKIYSTLSVIGLPITTPAGDKLTQNAALTSERRWPVTISYFEQGRDDAPPAYVLTFELYENGVSRALKVDYGNFALRGDLVDFTPAAAAACSK